MINRREFLIGSTSLLLAACARTGPAALLSRPRRTRYSVVTQSTYWSGTQDFSGFGDVKRVEIPGLPSIEAGKPFSVLTSVNEDGSDVRRLMFPMYYHCVVTGPRDDLIYLVGNHRPTALVTLDARTLEVVNVQVAGNGDERTFGGHGVWLPGGDHMAFTMNGFRRGAYDFISIRDARTLKEVESYSTYGFQAHEIRLSPDGKFFVCGHYGSYLGQGPYKGLSIYGSQGAYSVNNAPKIVYPASVTLVDAKNGKRVGLMSDRRAGQEGHADADNEHHVYLPNLPARLETRAGLETHPRFQPGEAKGEDHGEFAVTDHSVGISLSFDPVHREVIVPHRGELTIYVTDEATNRQRDISLRDQLTAAELAWLKPTPDFLSGLAFHPDGKHYVISTSSGFVALERGTHRVNHAMSFPLPLQVHSHLAILRA